MGARSRTERGIMMQDNPPTGDQFPAGTGNDLLQGDSMDFDTSVKLAIYSHIARTTAAPEAGARLRGGWGVDSNGTTFFRDSDPAPGPGGGQGVLCQLCLGRV